MVSWLSPHPVLTLRQTSKGTFYKGLIRHIARVGLFGALGKGGIDSNGQEGFFPGGQPQYMAALRFDDPTGAAEGHFTAQGAIKIRRQAECAGDHGSGTTAGDPLVDRGERRGARTDKEVNALGRIGAGMGVEP